MEDLSLHILDIVENSIDAGAKIVEINICEDLKEDLLIIEIIDDGKGMDQDMLKKALDPFFTTKTVRKVGMGLSLFREAARIANGDLSIKSVVGRGTILRAAFQHSHIDRKPLGDMAKTMITLIVGHPEIRFKYLHRKNDMESRLDTEEFRNKRNGLTTSVIELTRLIKLALK